MKLMGITLKDMLAVIQLLEIKQKFQRWGNGVCFERNIVKKFFLKEILKIAGLIMQNYSDKNYMNAFSGMK